MHGAVLLRALGALGSGLVLPVMNFGLCNLSEVSFTGEIGMVRAPALREPQQVDTIRKVLSAIVAI